MTPQPIILFCALLLPALGAKAWPAQMQKVEIRTHDQKNPFVAPAAKKTIVSIANERGRSWREGRWSPIVQVVGRDPYDGQYDRVGTGFVFARFRDSLGTGVLILTAAHVLPSSSYSDPENPESAQISFFDQVSRRHQGVTRMASLVSTSSWTDLAVLRVAMNSEELKNFVLPPLAVVPTTNFANSTWSPRTFRIGPANMKSDPMGYTELRSDVATNMTIYDLANSLALGVFEFWHVPGLYQPGMSGAPLVANQVLSAAGKPQAPFEDVIFGVLGYIFDVHGTDGYAYPLGNDFISLVQQLNGGSGLDCDRSESRPGRVVNFDLELQDYSVAEDKIIRSRTLSFRQQRSCVLVEKYHSEGPSLDGVHFEIQATAESDPEVRFREQAFRLSSGRTGGQPGSGSNGTPGSGSNGTPGSGSNGTPGSQTPLPPRLERRIELDERDATNRLSDSKMIIGFATASNPEIRPLTSLKLLTASIFRGEKVILRLGDRWDRVDDERRRRDQRGEPLIEHTIGIEQILDLFPQISRANVDFSRPLLVSGRFVGLNSNSRLASGSVRISIPLIPAGGMELNWRMSFLQREGAWSTQKSSWLGPDGEALIPVEKSPPVFQPFLRGGHYEVIVLRDGMVWGVLRP